MLIHVESCFPLRTAQHTLAKPLHFYACHALPLQHVAHLRPYVAEPSLSVASLSQASPLLSRAKLRHNFAVVVKQSFATAFFSLPTVAAANPARLFFSAATHTMLFRRHAVRAILCLCADYYAILCLHASLFRFTLPPRSQPLSAVAVQSNSQLCRCFSIADLRNAFALLHVT